MSDTKHAGRYIAAEVRSFEYSPAEPPMMPEPETVTTAATAPLLETAVANMMPEQLISFYRWYGELP